ncbi:ribonuclease P protein component [Patescibacteria group bacterium]|nr:ribonuclease P protein component [Patescibacteria group bacterium]
MLPKTYRLPLKTELNRLKKDGQIFQGKFFGLLLSPGNLNNDTSRFAVIVSNKIDKRAVKRNKIRRLINEVLKSLWPKIKTGVEGVFLVKKTATEATFEEIKNEIEKLFKKAKLFLN